MMWIIVFIIFIVPVLVIAILMVVTEREKPLKTKARELVIAFHEANNVPTLPKSIEDFHASIPVRGFRVLGGMSAYLSFKGSLVDYSDMIADIITAYGAIFLFYMAFILFTRLVLTTRNWIQGKYSARNSPIKPGPHVLKNYMTCGKWFCIISGGGVSTIGAIELLDNMLVKEGMPRYFHPTFVTPLMQSAIVQGALVKAGIQPYPELTEINKLNVLTEKDHIKYQNLTKTISGLEESQHLDTAEGAKIRERLAALKKQREDLGVKVKFGQTKIGEALSRAGSNNK